jgi:hypothetical protein
MWLSRMHRTGLRVERLENGVLCGWEKEPRGHNDTEDRKHEEFFHCRYKLLFSRGGWGLCRVGLDMGLKQRQ